MTRKEEIYKVSEDKSYMQCIAPAVFAEGFIEGAEWADQNPKNKVHFFLKKKDSDSFSLYMKFSTLYHKIFEECHLHMVHLNPNDFSDMKVDEMREVFINLED